MQKGERILGPPSFPPSVQASNQAKRQEWIYGYTGSHKLLSIFGSSQADGLGKEGLSQRSRFGARVEEGVGNRGWSCNLQKVGNKSAYLGTG